MARPLYAQLSLPALRANVARARELAPGTELLAVVKANAYGHGLMRLLPALAEADGLALIELDAAIALRAAHYIRRILLLEGFFTPDELPEIAARRLAVVVHSEDQVRMLELARLERPLEVFIKVNTGMNRLGFALADVVRIVERLNHCESVAVLRLMTHFARADEDDGLKEPVAAVHRGVPRHALPALARQFRRRPAVRRSRRRHRPPGHHALRGDALPGRIGGGHRRAAGDDAALRDHRGAGAAARTRASAMAPPTPRPASGVSESSPAGTPTGIRVAPRTERRCSWAAGRRASPAAYRWT